MSPGKWQHPVVFVAAMVFSGLCLTSADVVQLTSGNIDSILANNELVFVNFYADWCRFSQILTPIFAEAEKKVKEMFPQEGKVVFGRIDCDRETALSSLYRVGKYPTLKVFRYGSPAKREYRGQRSAESISNFIRDQLTDPVSVVTNLDDLDNLEWQKAHMIGYYETDQSDEYKTFERVASVLRHDCNFHAATGPITAKERIAGNKVVYRPSVDPDNEMTYSGSTGDFSLLLRWATDKCVPLVRELTFENAEEMTEEGLPFLILFHHADDLVTPQRFKTQVAVELLPERTSINFLTADGDKFTHPLHHLGKKPDDLPVIAIDSFKHMYVWPHDPKTDVDSPGLLKQFILDLHSGKLHRDFHTPAVHRTEREQPEEPEAEDAAKPVTDHVQKDEDSTEETKAPEQADTTDPPESLFKKLAPSRTRYTILRDEL